VTLCGGAALRTALGMGAAAEEISLPLALLDSRIAHAPPPLRGRVGWGAARSAVARRRHYPPPGNAVALPICPSRGEGPNTPPGTIIAVFARSFYLADAAGGLACIGPADLGGGPLNMLCALPAAFDWQASGLNAGDTVSSDGVQLQVAGRFRFSLAGAVAWRPTPAPASWDVATFAAGLAVLSKFAADHATNDGFAPLVASLASHRPKHPGLSVSTSPLLDLALPGIASLADWLASGGSGAPPASAEILIGLGPGLTPSGDDLIGGAMIALRALGRVEMAARLAAWALPLAAQRTGAISAAHLTCAAAGEGSFALHDLVAALLTPGAPGLVETVATLAAIGHSSGWDMLAGVALVGDAVANAA
jgi:hypothetical protein